MKDFIEYLIKEIVTTPDDVKVEEVKDSGFITYNIHVSQEDMGIIIGKEGRTIKSIRNLARAKAIKDNIHIQINIEEIK